MPEICGLTSDFRLLICVSRRLRQFQTATIRAQRMVSKIVVPRRSWWHGCVVKTVLSKPANGATAADAEVRQLRATGKRIAADKKSILRFLAATGMYTATGKLKPQFR